jgi:PAS domain S-box-containing protein
MFLGYNNFMGLPENFNEFIFDNAAEGIFQSTPEGRFLRVNTAMAKIFGYATPAEMIETITNISLQIHASAETRAKFTQFLEKQGSVANFEALNKRKDGTTFWTSTNAQIVRGAAGIVQYYVGFVQDITSRKETEQALGETETRYRALVEHFPAILYMDAADGSNRTIYISPQVETMLGWTSAQWIADPRLWEESIHPEDRARVLAESIRTDKDGNPFSVEYRIINRNGNTLWIQEESTLIHDMTGNPLYWQGFLLDITNKKQTQENMRDMASAYRGLFDSVSDAIYIQDREGRFLDVNMGAVSMYGYPREFFIGKTPEAISAPDRNDLKVVRKALARAFKDLPQQFEFWGMRKNGKIFPKDVRLYKGSYFGEEVVVAFAQDITDRKRVEEALHRRDAILEAAAYASERFLKARNWEECVQEILARFGQAAETSRAYIFRNKPGPRGRLLADQIYEWCAPGVTLQLENPKLQNFDYRKEGFTHWVKTLGQGEIVCDLVENLPPKSQVELSAEGILSILNAPIFANNIWWGFIGYDDCLYNREWSQPEIEALKTAASILGAAIERHQVADALSQSEEQYRTLIEQASDGIFITESNGKFLEVNPSGCRMLGYEHGEILNINLRDIMDKEDLAKRPLELLNVVSSHSTAIERRLIRKDETSFLSEISANKLPDGRLQGIVRDITDRRRAQDAQERQLQELSILHTLALAGTRAGNENELIEQATEIIGYTLYPDILGILLVTDDGKAYYPHPSYRGVSDPSQMHNHPIGKGVAGQVIATGKAIKIRDVKSSKNYIRVNPTSVSELCVPLTIGERVIGAINAESSHAGFFTANDERLLLTIAGQLAPAIERLRTERAEREQRLLAEALRDIASVLNSTLEFNTVLDRMLENIDRVVPSKSANIMLLENNVLRIIRHRGYMQQGADDWRENFSEPLNHLPDMSKGAQTCKPQLVTNTQKDPQWVTFPATEWIRSHLSAPILQDGEAIGFINLDHDTLDFFTQRDAERLMAFSNQAATAIQNARLFQAESRRAKIIEALAEIANVIATTREIGNALDEIAHRSLNLLDASHVAIYLLQEDNETLKIVTAKGSYRDELLSHTLKIGKGITGSIVASGKAEIINDTAKDPRRIRVPGTPDDSGNETMMSAPLILRGTSIGAINVWRMRSNKLFGESELNFLVSIAHQASIAIESGRLFEETIRRAQETAAIAEVGRDISSTLQLDVVLERIAAYAKDLLGAETSAVYLVDPNLTDLRAIAAIGEDADELKSDPLQIGTGILGNIALQKYGEIVNDTYTDLRAITIKGTEPLPFEHIMGVPVLLKDKLTGLLAVWRHGAGQDYKSTDLDFLSGLAQQAAIAIENARLYLSEQQRRQEAETLREATAVVATTLDRGRAINLILDQLARVLKYDSAAIQLLRDGYLEIVGGRGWQADASIIGLRFPIPGNNPNTIVIQERRPLVLDKINNTFESFQEEPHSHIRSWMGVPLIAHGEVFGMLAVDSAEEGHFNEEHIRLVSAYANQAAIAIDNAQLHERSEDQIRHLTALRDVDTAIASSLDLRVTLNILMDNAVSQLHADGMDIMVYNPNTQTLEIAATLGFHGRVTRRQIRIGEELAGKIAINRKPLQIHDLTGLPEYSRLGWLAEEKFLSYVGYPLLGKGQVKGVLEAYFRTPHTPNADWLEFMQTMAGQAAIAIDNAQLFENLQRSNQELSLAYDTTLEGWGKALELRDKETEGHTRRVTELTMRLARRMRLGDTEITHIRRGVLLHDIGKMGVPDHILRKTGPLEETEWELMRKHPQYAYDLLYPIAYLRPALEIPFCHHEKWDGSGYPRGLKGEEIPLAARIFAVVDVWDALLSDRPYRKSWPRKNTLDYIQKEAGARFDPRIVNLFIEMVAEQE